MIHSNSVKNHKIENWTYANAAARTGATGFLAADIGKLAYQTDNQTYWRLTAVTPTWIQAMAGPAGADGADGAAGPGVPTGGTADQILAKIDGTNYNTHWIDAPSGGGGALTMLANMDETGGTVPADDPVDHIDLLSIPGTGKNLRIEGFFRGYDVDYTDTLGNLLLYFNANYTDSDYWYATNEDAVHTDANGAPVVAKSGIYGAHHILIEIPMYSSTTGFSPTAFVRSIFVDASGMHNRESIVRFAAVSGSPLTQLRLKTSLSRLEFHGRAYLL
jgi:hypothetical protein